MPQTMHDILHPGNSETDGRFGNAPAGWTMHDAVAIAEKEELRLNEDHWRVIRVVQSVYAEDQKMPIRMLHDALEAHFQKRGGLRYLFSILPGGPIVQGCRLAGLIPPQGANDESFGTVC